MTDAFVGVSYCGEHVKSTGRIDPHDHTRMLKAVVDQFAPLYPVLVAATAFDLIDIPDEPTRLLAWDIFHTAKVSSLRHNPAHQFGAAWCLFQALEYGATGGFEYMLFTSDDVVMNTGTAQAVIDRLREGYDYVGDRWGGAGDTLNTQVFGCRVPALLPGFREARRYNPVEFQGAGMILEQYFWRVIERAGLKADIRPVPYMHTHDPAFFFDLYNRMLAGDEIR